MSKGIKIVYCGLKEGKMTRDAMQWGLTGYGDIEGAVALLKEIISDPATFTIKDGKGTVHVGQACGGILPVVEGGRRLANWLHMELGGALKTVWENNKFLELHKELLELRADLDEKNSRVSILKRAMKFHGPIENWPESDRAELEARENVRDAARAVLAQATKEITKHIHDMLREFEDKILGV